MKRAYFGKPLLVGLALSMYAWLAAAPADAIAQRNWIGSLVGDRLFGTSGNWDGATPIATGDYLTFGATVNVSGDLINNLQGYSATRLTFTGSYGFTLKGNPLTVTESIIVNNDGGEHQIELDVAGKADTLVGRNARLHLSGANTFTGQVDVNGTLYAESNTALGSTAGPTKINAGGLLRINGRDLAESLLLNGAGLEQCSVQNDGGVSILRDVQIAGTVCIVNVGTLNFPNGIGQFAPGFDLLLAEGTNLVGGASNADGVLRLAAGGDLRWDSNAKVQIRSEEIFDVKPVMNLSGSGTATSLDYTGGTFAPGSASATGRFTLTGSFLIESANLAILVNGTTAGTGHSAVQTGGPVTIGASTELQFLLAVGYTPTIGSQYRIIDNTGNQPVSGTFAGLPEGARFQAGGRPFSITYKGGSGNDVVVTALTPDLRPFKRIVMMLARD
ncbi:MAG: hypothetical protein ABI577_08675 [bacterium]